MGIQDPFDTSRRLATVRLKNRAMGTSGSEQQYLEAGGRRYGHILDPRTGWPASELASVSVLADDAATADALATALFVMGLDKARDFCQNHRDTAALLVLKPGGAVLRSGRDERTSTLPQVVTFNMPEQDLDLYPGR